MRLNDPAVIQEVEMALDRYQRALLADDTSVLETVFWHSENTVRFGANETLIGADEIRRYRSNRAVKPAPLETIRRVISTFGDDVATVNIIFRRHDRPDQIGRWSQSWVRFADGWKITAAHVSSIKSN